VVPGRLRFVKNLENSIVVLEEVNAIEKEKLKKDGNQTYMLPIGINRRWRLVSSLLEFWTV